MAKFNKGYKLLKFYRNRFSAKGEGRGTQSNTSAEGEKNLLGELRLPVPLVCQPARQRMCKQDSERADREWSWLGRQGAEAGGCVLGGTWLFCVLGKEGVSRTLVENQLC